MLHLLGSIASPVNLRYVAMGVAAAGVLALAVAWQMQRSENHRLRAENTTQRVQLDLMQQLAEENEAVRQGERVRYENAMRAAQDDAKRATAVRKTLNIIREATGDEQDGPVAPVLSGTLDGLRKLNASASDRDEAEAGTGAASATSD